MLSVLVGCPKLGVDECWIELTSVVQNQEKWLLGCCSLLFPNNAKRKKILSNEANVKDATETLSTGILRRQQSNQISCGVWRLQHRTPASRTPRPCSPEQWSLPKISLCFTNSRCYRSYRVVLTEWSGKHNSHGMQRWVKVKSEKRKTCPDWLRLCIGFHFSSCLCSSVEDSIHNENDQIKWKSFDVT